MRSWDFLRLALLASVSHSAFAEAANKPRDAVLLSKIASLTLRDGKQTSHRRVSSIPQLRCIGGSAMGLYDVDVMRCKNAGSSYDDAEPDWTCTASLPPEFKLGSTDVICEGYSSPNDPYILKGSCGVEYRLILTEKGEQKFGQRREPRSKSSHSFGDDEPPVGRFVAAVFWLIFGGVALWILYNFIKALGDQNAGRRPPRTGGGGGGWFPGGGDDDPPPPYDYQPGSGKPYRSNSGNNQQQGWRPGFWTGALGGGAAGYYAGQRAANRGQDRSFGSFQPPRSYSPGEGRSSTVSSSRYTSTGFGSTSRR